MCDKLVNEDVSYNMFCGCRQSQQFLFHYSPFHATTCFSLYKPSSSEIYTVICLKAIASTTDPFLGYTVYYFILL
jgi:hypothetical protein